MARVKSKPLRLVPRAAAQPVPSAHVEAIAELLADARSGVVEGFVFVAVGPDFTRWREGFVRGGANRHNLLGQLMMAVRAIQDAELES